MVFMELGFISIRGRFTFVLCGSVLPHGSL